MSTENKISFYASAKDIAPMKAITIRELVAMIRDGDTTALVAQVREAPTEESKRAAKFKLPAVQLSGYITKGKRAQAIQEGRFVHSGWLQLDLDGGGLNGKTPEEAKEKLGKDPHVLSAFISPSGQGAKALFRIKPCLTDAEHKAAFIAVEEHILSTYGLTIDPSTKDVGRLCFIPSDPDATWNDNAEQFIPPSGMVAAYPVDRANAELDEFPEPPINGINNWLPRAARYCEKNGMTEEETVTRLQSYDGRLRRPLQPNEAQNAARMVYSTPSDSGAVPENVLPVPAGAISFSKSAEIVFNTIAKNETMFIRETVVHEIRSGLVDTLHPVEPDRFCSAIEKMGKRVARRETGTDGKPKWRSCTFPTGAAKTLLATDEARTLLPTVRQLANSPILTKDGQILTRGYHAYAGGTYISSGDTPPDISLERAVRALTEILKDFNFTTPADLSRAVASLISPAMKLGGHIDDDFPLDLAEADQSQSGKTYRQRIVAALYNERPSVILPPKGGVGSLDELISKSLIEGRPFIALDNIRGRLDSGILESAIRGHGRVTARALRTSAEVDTTTFLWQLSTNGAELTRDLANRSIITRIRKQPDGYKFHDYLEGDLLAHIKSNQSTYMGAIFAIVRAWMKAGSPKTSESRHDFRGWVRVMDWIVQNLFSLPPLLDGHREEQTRTANPNLQWLRDIVLGARPEILGHEMSATEIVSIIDETGIEFPGNPNSNESHAMRVGRILGKLFRETDGQPIVVDGFKFSRLDSPEYSESTDGSARKFYTITRVAS